MVTKAKIVIEDKAANDGKIEIVVTPEKGQPVTIAVLVAKKTKGREVVKDLAKNMKVTLGSAYKIGDSGDSVEIKGKDKQKFSVALGSNTVSGMSVKVK